MDTPAIVQTTILNTVHEFVDGEVTQAKLREVNEQQCEAIAVRIAEICSVELKIQTAEDVSVDLPDGPEQNHVWLSDGSRHYDIEAPHGVESWEQLPRWKRWEQQFAVEGQL